MTRFTGLSKNTGCGSAESLEYSPSPKKTGAITGESKETSRQDADNETV